MDEVISGLLRQEIERQGADPVQVWVGASYIEGGVSVDGDLDLRAAAKNVAAGLREMQIACSTEVRHTFDI